MEEHSIAYELLEEVKRGNERLETSNKKLFFIAIAELVVIIIMVIGFLVYESQYNYADETYTQEATNTESSNITQTIN